MKRDCKRGISFSRWGGFEDRKHPIYFSGDTKSIGKSLPLRCGLALHRAPPLCFYRGLGMGGFFGDRYSESIYDGHSSPHFLPASVFIRKETPWTVVRVCGMIWQKKPCVICIIRTQGSFHTFIQLPIRHTKGYTCNQAYVSWISRRRSGVWMRGYTVKLPCTSKKFTVKANIPVSVEYNNGVNIVTTKKTDVHCKIIVELS